MLLARTICLRLVRDIHFAKEHQPVNPGRPLQPRRGAMRPVQPEERDVPVLIVGVLPETLETFIASVASENLHFGVAAIVLLIAADPVPSTNSVVDVDCTRA